MTVQELIDELELVKDKSAKVQVYNQWLDEWETDIYIDDMETLVRLQG